MNPLHRTADRLAEESSGMTLRDFHRVLYRHGFVRGCVVGAGCAALVFGGLRLLGVA